MAHSVYSLELGIGLVAVVAATNVVLVTAPGPGGNTFVVRELLVHLDWVGNPVGPDIALRLAPSFLTTFFTMNRSAKRGPMNYRWTGNLVMPPSSQLVANIGPASGGGTQLEWLATGYSLTP